MGSIVNPLVIFGLALYYYGATRWQEISPGIASQLLTAAAEGGVAASPGHCLLTILLRLWLKLMSSLNMELSVAAAGSLFNGLQTGGAELIRKKVSKFQKLSYYKVTEPISAVITTSTFMVSAVLWKNCTQLEVFGLNSLLIMGTLFCFMRTKDSSLYYKGVFCMGTLALTNIMSAIVILPVLLITFYQGCRGNRHSIDIVQICAFFLLVHLYIPISARYSNTNYTSVGGYSMKEIFAYITQDTQLNLMFDGKPSTTKLMIVLTSQYNHIIKQFGTHVTVAAVLGFILSFRRVTTTLIALGFLTWSMVFGWYCNFNPLNQHQVEAVHQYWIIPNFFVTIFAAQGISIAITMVVWTMKKVGVDVNRFNQILSVVVIAYLVKDTHKMMPERMGTSGIFKATTMTYLNSFPKDSIIIVNNDMVMSGLAYFQSRENIRSDLTIIDLKCFQQEWFHKKKKLYKNVAFPGMHISSSRSLPELYTINDFAKENKDRPILFSKNTLTSGVLDQKHYSMEPWGLFYRIYYRQTSSSFDDDYKERVKTYLKKTSKFPYAYEDYKKTRSSLDYELLYNYWQTKGSIAAHTTELAENFIQQQKTKTAIRYWKQSVEVLEIMIDQIAKEYEERYPSDPLLAIPPYYFEQSARNLMKLAEHATDKVRISRYIDAWDQYERYVKYSKHHKDPLFTTDIEKQLTALLANFEKDIGSDKRTRSRSKVWKKSI